MLKSSMDIYSSKSRKKKIGRVFLVLWLLSIAVFGFCLYLMLAFSALYSRNAFVGITGLIAFWAGALLLPVWGFLLGNKLLRIIAVVPVSLVIFFFIVYLLVLRPYRISGNSMLPFLKSGDYILSEKVSYYFESPKRGDVIVFTPPIPGSNKIEYIARIVGLPGENISVKNGHLYINNKILDEPYLAAGVKTASGPDIGDNNILIPQNSYVVLGDNRGLSNDSRHYGFVARSSISGREFFVYWSSSSAKSVDLNIGENKFPAPLLSCRTLGGKMIAGSDGKGQIGCDVLVDGPIDLTKSYCQGQTTLTRKLLIPDAFGRKNQYYVTLTGLNFNEEVRIFVYDLGGSQIECLPPLNK